MKMSTRTLTALLLAGAMSSVAACGDDDEEGPTPTPDGGTPDTGVPNIDSGTVDTGTPGPVGDSSTVADTGASGIDSGVSPMLTACPTDPHIVDIGMVCRITAPANDPITQDLVLAPVMGKQGYLLQGGVFVGQDRGGAAAPDATKARATLTIRPGTRIFGSAGISFLLINRGSAIDAQGTPEDMIVFTSSTTPKATGQWGGVFINGRAPNNRGTDAVGEAGTGAYGGPDADDNSGKFRYVRIEYGGAAIDPENEFNGLTMQSVGRGTEIDHVHVHANADDGIEWFGGSVNAKYLVVTQAGDDGLDWVAGYSGKVQYAIVQQGTMVSSGNPNGIEADNSSTATATPISNPIWSNVTLIGGTGAAAAKGAILRAGTQGQLYNALILDFTVGCLEVGGAESQSYVGNQLALWNSRISCATNFINPEAQTLFEAAGKNNSAIAPGTAVLSDAHNLTAPKFTPVAGSPVLTGGAAPAGDAFFTPVAFVGAVGEMDWTAGWVTIP